MERNGLPLSVVVSSALSAAMNEHLVPEFGCRPLRWSVDTSAHGDGRLHLSAFPGADYTDEDGVGVIAEWVAALGLTQHTAAPAGLADYSGRIGDHVEVLLWAIVDRAAFERRPGRG